MWHTHPDHQARPSPTDQAGMQQLLTPATGAAPRAIMVILGGQPPIWSAWLDRRSRYPTSTQNLSAAIRPEHPARPAVPVGHDQSAWPGGFCLLAIWPGQMPAPPSWPTRLRAWIRQLRRTKGKAVAMTTPRIGVAISGGGFRATAFGLGCLRALHDTGLLPGVSVISGISGGSLLAALYAYGPQDFTDFDHTTTSLLRSGLQAALIRRALSPPAAARNLAAAGRVLLPRRPGGQPRLRTANRTDALRDELAHRVFGDRVLGQVTHRDLATVITATDLRTGNAVRFGSLNSSCSAYGIITSPVTIAEAVAASAAFPLLLPAMERTYTFTRPGRRRTKPARSPADRWRDLRQPRPDRPGTGTLSGPHRPRLRRRLHHRLRRRPGEAPARRRPLRRNPPAAQLRHRPPASPGRRARQAPRRSRHRPDCRASSTPTSACQTNGFPSRWPTWSPPPPSGTTRPTSRQ